jgi:cell wall-associated NlpC family hydrolase
VASIAAVVAGTALPAMAAAPASPRQRVADLYRQAEAATQAYDGVQERMTALQRLVAEHRGELAAAQQTLRRSETALGALAAAQYRAGGMNQRLQMMLSEQPAAFLQQLTTWTQLSDAETAQLAIAHDEQVRAATLETETSQQLAELSQLSDQLAATRARVQSEIMTAQQLVIALPAPQQAAIAADPAAGLGTAGAGTTGTGVGDVTPVSPLPLTNLLDAATGLDNRAQSAVRAAYAELGKPYIYGATGPDAYDCSGLTQHVWAAAGVQLPRTSQEQANAGTPVPVGKIHPGDLVIYYPDATHVGIYVGDGYVIHAPHPGGNVEMSPLTAMPINRVVAP